MLCTRIDDREMSLGKSWSWGVLWGSLVYVLDLGQEEFVVLPKDVRVIVTKLVKCKEINYTPPTNPSVASIY